jgi:hypothetical protein
LKSPNADSCFTQRHREELAMMINQRMMSSNPEVERLIRELLTEDARYDRELRSAHRENLVFPVSICLEENDQNISGFSRNVSVTGICVLCETQIPSGERATLEIYRLHRPEPSRVLAECRWCKPFGDTFYASGWQFLGLARD